MTKSETPLLSLPHAKECEHYGRHQLGKSHEELKKYMRQCSHAGGPSQLSAASASTQSVTPQPTPPAPAAPAPSAPAYNPVCSALGAKCGYAQEGVCGTPKNTLDQVLNDFSTYSNPPLWCFCATEAGECG